MKRYTFRQLSRFLKEAKPAGSVLRYRWIVSPYELNQIAKLNNFIIKKDPDNIDHVVGFKKGAREVTFRYDEEHYILYSDYTVAELLHRTKSDLKEKKQRPIEEEQEEYKDEDI